MEMIVVVVVCCCRSGVRFSLIVAAAAAAAMGCSGSKVDDLPLVVRCRERKDLIRRAAEHRYALANAHVAYFDSLRLIGEALHRFVDEDLVLLSSSCPSSPVLTLPSDRQKFGKKSLDDCADSDGKRISASSSVSHSGSGSHVHSIDSDDSGHYDHHHHGSDRRRHGRDHDDDASHLHLSSDDSGSTSSSGHFYIREDNRDNRGPSFSPLAHTDWAPYETNQRPQSNWAPYGFNPQSQAGWDPYFANANPFGYGGNPNSFPYGGNYASHSHMYYMKKSSPAVRTVIHEAEPSSSQRVEPAYAYSGYPYENAGFFGFPVSSSASRPGDERQPTPPADPPPPPSPKVSAWDIWNPFDVFDNGYPGYYSEIRHGHGSIASSPDSSEVRQREGIPDLEDETESEHFGELQKVKKVQSDGKKSLEEDSSNAMPSHRSDERARSVPKHTIPGTSKALPSDTRAKSSRARSSSHGSERTLRSMPSDSSEDATRTMSSQGKVGPTEEVLTQSKVGGSVGLKKENGSPDTIMSVSSAGGHAKKKGASFEVEEASHQDAESSKLSSLTTLSSHGTRDFKEVISEIKDEFEIASSYGRDVALMLEVGKLPYHPGFMKVMLTRLQDLVAPSLSSSQAPSIGMTRSNSKTGKLAKSYYTDDNNSKPSNLLSTLEKLYEWEKKLYKEVKDEERLRVIYEKQCRRLKILDNKGAESRKIDATEASIRKLLTKLNVCIKAINAISSRIHKLRDEELQPQVNELIQRLVQMWKAMFKCHQKQFQAIMESKTRFLKARGGFQRDSNLRATVELETELLTWCSRFNEWINFQRSYAESLNEWLMRCLKYEPEITSDGIVPFSPGRLGAPPIFVICHDWNQAMATISESVVADSVHHFASNLRQLWETQSEERQHRQKAEYLSKDFETRLRALWMENGRMKRQQDAASDKTGASIAASESGVSPLDNLKVDLDSMKDRLAKERARHKDAVKLVQDAVSGSLQGGLIPVFGALKDFTSETLRAHEQVRIQNSGQEL